MKKNKTILAAIIAVIVIILSYIGLDSTNILSPSQSSTPVSIPENSIQYYFPKDNQPPKPALISIIDNAKEKLDIAIYSITDTDIVNSMAAAEQRGVKVRVIADATQSASKSQNSALDVLRNAGITIKINKHSGLMHLKMMIVDGQIATTGSFNYTSAAENINDEVFVVINNPEVATDFENQFERMWNDTSGFIEY